MNQPNLGKKIAELRLAKGLTQEALAEKCNLSLRTIQRIESAEVSPRSYTVKAIFSSLDYDFFNSFGKLSYRLDKTAYMIKNWPAQVYRFLSDLFNLKTKTMKKLAILSIPIMTIVIVLFISNENSIAQNLQKRKSEFTQIVSSTDFVRLFNAGKIDSVCLSYSFKACMMPDQYPTIIGRDKITDYYLQMYARGIRFTEAKATYHFVADTIAIERGTWTVKVSPELSITGSYLSQWHYQNGKWMIENEMSKQDFMPLGDK